MAEFKYNDLDLDVTNYTKHQQGDDEDLIYARYVSGQGRVIIDARANIVADTIRTFILNNPESSRADAIAAALSGIYSSLTGLLVSQGLSKDEAGERVEEIIKLNRDAVMKMLNK